MRAFIAIELHDELREQIARLQHDLRGLLASVKRVRITWVRPASIHLTIKFLGDVDERQVDPIRDVVSASLAGRGSGLINLTRLGAFPRPTEPRTLWVGPEEAWPKTETAQQLTASIRAIDDGCARFVEPENKAWRAHLTLARVREGEREVGRVLVREGIFTKRLDLDPLRLDAVHLMKSELRPDGPVHTRLWTVPLR